MFAIQKPTLRSEELEERRTLDYLGFASLLMLRLDDAEERREGAA